MYILPHFNPYQRICLLTFREKEREKQRWGEREREKDRLKRETLIACPYPHPMYTPLLGINHNLGRCPDQESNLQPFGV